jgi:hypothetical protein
VWSVLCRVHLNVRRAETELSFSSVEETIERKNTVAKSAAGVAGRSLALPTRSGTALKDLIGY